MIYVGIDPGVGCTALAFIRVINRNPLRVLGFESIKGKNFEHSFSRVNLVVDTVDDYRIVDSIRVVLEMPRFYQSSGGLLCARAGSLIKLAMLTGSIYGKLKVICEPTLIDSSIWKGQLPKNVAKRRTKKFLSGSEWVYRPKNEHEWDALGLAVWGVKNAASRKA